MAAAGTTDAAIDVVAAASASVVRDVELEESGASWPIRMVEKT